NASLLKAELLWNRRSLVDKSNKSKGYCRNKIKLPTEGGRLRGFFLEKIKIARPETLSKTQTRFGFGYSAMNTQRQSNGESYA
ncbi:MAG: hypothetical protein ACYTXY_16675, partial [Nostoc sp.]